MKKENGYVHPYCDICSKDLSKDDIKKNEEQENYEFPICGECFNDAYMKIKYILEQ